MKCVSCESKIEKDNAIKIIRGEYEGKYICEPCEADDLNEPKATILYFKDGQKFTALAGHYSYLDEYGSQTIQDFIDSIEWHSTDGWRGYYEGKTPKGFVKVVDDWFCGFDGHNVSRENYLEQLNDMNDRNECPPFEMIMVFYRTSNLFSTAIDVFVKDEQEFKNYINEVIK